MTKPFEKLLKLYKRKSVNQMDQKFRHETSVEFVWCPRYQNCLAFFNLIYALFFHLVFNLFLF